MPFTFSFSPLFPNYTLFYKLHEPTAKVGVGPVALTDLIGQYSFVNENERIGLLTVLVRAQLPFEDLSVLRANAGYGRLPVQSCRRGMSR